LAPRAPEDHLRLAGSGEGPLVVAVREARGELEDPVPAHHGADAIGAKSRFECGFVERRQERRGFLGALDRRDIALLAEDEIDREAVARPAAERGELLRLAPHLFERVAAYQPARDELRGAVSCPEEIAGLHPRVERPAVLLDRDTDRLLPRRDQPHRILDPAELRVDVPR